MQSLWITALSLMLSVVAAEAPYRADLVPMVKDLFLLMRVVGTVLFLSVNFFLVDPKDKYKNWVEWFVTPFVVLNYHQRIEKLDFCCYDVAAKYETIMLWMFIPFGITSLVRDCCPSKQKEPQEEINEPTGPAPSHLAPALQEDVIRFVNKHMKNNDASHDMQHVIRVWVNAREISRAVEEDVDEEVVELAALLHDMYDPKYVAKDEEKENLRTPRDEFTRLLKPHGVSDDQIQRICDITQYMSFKESIRQRYADEPNPPICATLEFAIVRDADWLDAVGAIGLARLFTFGGAKKRRLFDSTILPLAIRDADTYHKESAEKSTTINHIYEKLMYLTNNMSTAPAKRWAQERRTIMVTFMDQFFTEMSESADAEMDLEDLTNYEKKVESNN